jgi:hypothetical protein
MSDVEDHQSWMTAAFNELRRNLDDARDLVRAGQDLERLKVGAFDVPDMYRAAWVQAVSALDHWIHHELYDRALGLALNIAAPRPDKFLDLRIPMRLFEDVHHHSKNLREPFLAYLHSEFGHVSFQNPDKIREALRYVSPQVIQKQIVEDLQDIADRRNKIVHESDRDPQHGRARRPISDHEATLTIDRIEEIATAIARVLGPPPAGESGRSDDRRVSTRELYRQFWTQFKEVTSRRGWTNAVAPTDNWWSLPAGLTGASWVLSFARFGCRSELFFDHPDPALNLARWRFLADRRDDITVHFDEEVIFDALPNAKGCRIEVRLIGPTIRDTEKWPEILEWMEDSQVRLRSAVEAIGGIPRGL